MEQTNELILKLQLLKEHYPEYVEFSINDTYENLKAKYNIAINLINKKNKHEFIKNYMYGAMLMWNLLPDEQREKILDEIINFYKSDKTIKEEVDDDIIYL